MRQRDEQIEKLIQQLADQGDLYSYAAVNALQGLAESWIAMGDDGTSLHAMQIATRMDILATIEVLKDFLSMMQAEGLV